VKLLAGVFAACALAVCAPGASAYGGAFAPVSRPGPPLTVPAAKLRAALRCTAGVRHAKRAPVLLNPATGVTPDQNYSWNWERALTALGIPWCAYTAPYRTLGDIQTSGQYLVYAIRTMHRMAGRRIDIMGHSQGGMSMRWALRFWPDTRPMVDDIVGFAGSNHGTTVLKPSFSCGHGCPPAVWQQAAGARFIQALNSYDETFRGISYTNIYTHTDEVVQPNSNNHGSSSLHTGGGRITNVATQDICPLDTNEHLNVGTVDPAAYALAVDALTHSGPADPGRVSRSVCLRLYQPGVNPASANMFMQILAAQPGLLAVDIGGFNLVGAPEVKAEPPLACYVFANCPGGQTHYSLSVRPSAVEETATTFTFTARSRMWGTSHPLAGAVVSLAGHRVRTGRDGRAEIRLRLGRSHSAQLLVGRRVVASAPVRVV
jgi:hypothetical protein